MRRSSYHGVVLLAMRSGWADWLLAEIGRAAEARSSLKSRGLMCCAACFLACLLVKCANKVNWVHDPASLAGQSIGRGRDEQYSGRFLKVLITRSLSQEEGWMSGERCSRRSKERDGPVRARS
jgi:hypothetical protein